MKRQCFVVLLTCSFVYFATGSAWALKPAVTNVTPNTVLAGEAVNITITGSDFDSEAEVSLLNKSNSLAGFIRVPGYGRSVYVSGDYAYIGGYDDVLQIIDISSPNNPQITGTTTTPIVEEDVTVSGNYKCVGILNDENKYDVQVIDMSTLDNPAIIGVLELPQIPAWAMHLSAGLHVSGNYAYVLTVDAPVDKSPGKLWAVDISDPANPTLADFTVMQNEPLALYVSGNYAYVTTITGKLEVINISNPASLGRVGSFNTTRPGNDIHISGNYAYIVTGNDATYANGDSRLQIIDIGGSGNPAFTDFYNYGSANGMYLSGEYAYIATGDSGLKIIDTSDITTPYVVGFVDTSGYASDVYVSGNHAYIADGDSGIKIIDTSDASTPYIAGFVDTPGYASDVYVSGNHAYVADGDSGLQIISISSLDNLAITGSVSTLEYAKEVYVSGDYAYMTVGKLLQVISISDPVNPTLSASYEIKIPEDITGGEVTAGVSSISGMYVLDNYVYLISSFGSRSGWTSYTEGLINIVDINSPLNPSLVNSYVIGAVASSRGSGDSPDWPSKPERVYVSGNYIYVSYEKSGLRIIDRTNKNIRTVSAAGSVNEVVVSGNYIYITDNNSNFQVIDNTDEENPEFTGFCNTSKYTRNNITINTTVVGSTAITSAFPEGLPQGDYYILVKNSEEESTLYDGLHASRTDGDMDGFYAEQDDCNDNNNLIYPGRNEVCGDGIDQNCDGIDLTDCPDYPQITVDSVDINPENYFMTLVATIMDDSETEGTLFYRYIDGGFEYYILAEDGEGNFSTWGIVREGVTYRSVVMEKNGTSFTSTISAPVPGLNEYGVLFLVLVTLALFRKKEKHKLVNPNYSG